MKTCLKFVTEENTFTNKMQARLIQEHANLKIRSTEIEREIVNTLQRLSSLTLEQKECKTRITEVDSLINHPYLSTLFDVLNDVKPLVQIVEEYIPFCGIHRFFYLSQHCIYCIRGLKKENEYKCLGPLEYKYTRDFQLGDYNILTVTHPRDIEIFQEWRSGDDLARSRNIKLATNEFFIKSIYYCGQIFASQRLSANTLVKCTCRLSDVFGGCKYTLALEFHQAIKFYK